MKPSDAEIDQTNEEVHRVLAGLVERGLDDQILADLFIGYGLQIWEAHHGRQAVARHLYVLSLRFADPERSAVEGALPN